VRPKIITELKDAIRRVHGCEALFINAVHISTPENLSVWDGLVKVFELIGHPSAKRCYAWSYRDGAESRILAILEMPPIVSAALAVRMANSREMRA
jgi:hypothetical protein